jgi:hypothetical protein
MVRTYENVLENIWFLTRTLSDKGTGLKKEQLKLRSTCTCHYTNIVSNKYFT